MSLFYLSVSRKIISKPLITQGFYDIYNGIVLPLIMCRSKARLYETSKAKEWLRHQDVVTYYTKEKQHKRKVSVTFFSRMIHEPMRY